MVGKNHGSEVVTYIFLYYYAFCEKEKGEKVRESVRKQAFWDRFSLFFGADLVILKMGNFEDLCFKFAQRTPVLYI